MFLREFILGSNTTGLVQSTNGTVAVVGGENSTLAGDFLAGGSEIFYGSGATQSTTVFPSATVSAWDAFVASVTSAAGSAASATGTAGTKSAAPLGPVPRLGGVLVGLVGIAVVFCL